MQNRNSQLRPAVAARDAGRLRLRRATQLAATMTIALGAAFAALAAGSTHAKKTVARIVQPRVRVAASALAVAPAPPLVAAHSDAPPPSAAPASAPVPAAPASAPAPTYQAPVVVSGGS